MAANFVKLADGFYLNLDLVIEVNGSEVRYADGSVFTLDDECLEVLASCLEKYNAWLENQVDRT